MDWWLKKYGPPFPSYAFLIWDWTFMLAEAMTSDRAYRSSLDHAAARRELERCAGTQFDARVVDALIALLDRETERALVALGHS